MQCFLHKSQKRLDKRTIPLLQSLKYIEKKERCPCYIPPSAKV